MDMPETPAILKRKVAGVPVSIIALVVVAGLLYMAFKVKPAPTDTTTDPNADTGTGATDATSTDAAPESANQPVFSANPSPQPSTSGDGPVATDQTWSNQAIAWLISNQNASVQTATNAITKYLNQEQLSLEEGRLRDLALKQFGPPPESGYVQTSTAGYAGPAARQGNPPTTHTVKGKSDNTPEELARLYYGIAAADAVQYLVSNNPSLTEPYPVGTKVRIAKYHAPRYYVATTRNNTAGEIARANGRTVAAIRSLNPHMAFPVRVGTRVRVD